MIEASVVSVCVHVGAVLCPCILVSRDRYVGAVLTSFYSKSSVSAHSLVPDGLIECAFRFQQLSGWMVEASAMSYCGHVGALPCPLSSVHR